MKLSSPTFLFALLAPAGNYAYSPTSNTNKSEAASSNTINRKHFLLKTGTTAATVALIDTVLVANLPAAEARGRATLEQAYDRYTPRINSGGQYYTNELKAIIAKNDWAALAAATAEPPKRTKADKSKVDGGIAERAAQAGQFSDSRVLFAMDLYAATFSDNSVSTKTKAMKDEVEKLRKVVQGMRSSARIALGEEKAVEGGLFGFGGKSPSQAELAKKVRGLYVEGGNAYNQYVFAANDGLPITLGRLPYL